MTLQTACLPRSESGPSHVMQDTRIEPANRHGASRMGDGPDSITYVGLDVHKTTIAVAVAEGGRLGEVRQFGIYGQSR